MARQENRHRLVARLALALASIVVCETALLVWLWRCPVGVPGRPSLFHSIGFSPDFNVVRASYPNVDFSRLYPGMSTEDIDALQRECFSTRYVYAPFVQFEALPGKRRFVEITQAGYRAGQSEQPWPPRDDDLVVFVFGGSTTFGYGTPDSLTPVCALEDELAALYDSQRVECYNFGRGYYFSTQERILFEQLLLDGHVPDIAVFVDGLNDFYYPDGVPQLTALLYRCTAADLGDHPTLSVKTAQDPHDAVVQVIERYRENARMITALAQAYDISLLLVGQPVPFLEFDRSSADYPFPSTFKGHDLCRWGYARFRDAGLAGAFGARFIWCGDAFREAAAPMYADSIHYTPEGGRTLARTITSRAIAKELLVPFAEVVPELDASQLKRQDAKKTHNKS
jgi:hypothetical protein